MIVLKRLIVALIIYAIFILIIFATRPPLMFHADGRPKDFGVGLTEGRSVFALGFMLPLLAIVSYIVACTVTFAIA
jgi:hypothetical protein